MKTLNPFSDLSKTELSIWSISVIAILGSSITFGKSNPLSIIASLIGVTALIFVAKGYVLGQFLTIVFAVFYGIISFFFRYYGEVITYLCMTTPIAAMSAISWLRHPYRDTKEVEIATPSQKQIVTMLVLSALVTAIFYFILKAMNNSNLLPSTISVTTSFLACYLTFLRSPYYAIAYATNDLILIILWVLATMEDLSYLPMIVCFVMFFINDLYGFYNWKRMQKNQACGGN